MVREIQSKGQNIFAFSDTHGHHRDLWVPEEVDIIIYAGDAVEDALKGGEYDDFIEWFSSQPVKNTSLDQPSAGILR